VAVARSRVQALVEQRQRETTTLLPRSLEVVRMAEEAYQAGQIDLTALLQVMQTGRDVRLRTLDTSLALQWALADLERATAVVVP
jgi:outer membrane protein TolC